MSTGAVAEAGAKKAETVLVTGASGFIGSWVVLRLLLARGYSVHAAVLNPDDKAERDHLLALAGGGEEGRLRFFRCDLLDGAAMLAAARGCSGVLHLASPCTVERVLDPQKELMVPAVEGTLHVLRAAKVAGGVRRVVVTSSISAIIPSPGWPAGEVRDERCWTDIDYCQNNGVWYPASKTLAEKAAWKFAEENELDVVVVNPGMVLGPMIPPNVRFSANKVLSYLQDMKSREVKFSANKVLSHLQDMKSYSDSVATCFGADDRMIKYSPILFCCVNWVWYPASKMLADKAAWKFAENELDVVVVNPGTVLGPKIPPTVNASMAIFLQLLEGCTEEYADFFMGAVHVENIALAHILLYENPSATGRHLCVFSGDYSKRKDPDVVKQKEPILELITSAPVNRHKIKFTKQDISSLWFLCKQEACLLNITNQACQFFTEAEDCGNKDFCPFDDFKKKIVEPHLKHDYDRLCKIKKPVVTEGPSQTVWVYSSRKGTMLRHGTRRLSCKLD